MRVRGERERQGTMPSLSKRGTGKRGGGRRHGLCRQGGHGGMDARDGPVATVTEVTLQKPPSASLFPFHFLFL